MGNKTVENCSRENCQLIARCELRQYLIPQMRYGLKPDGQWQLPHAQLFLANFVEIVPESCIHHRKLIEIAQRGLRLISSAMDNEFTDQVPSVTNSPPDQSAS